MGEEESLEQRARACIDALDYIAVLEKKVERLEAELQDRAIYDEDGTGLASDIYFYCQELMEPYLGKGNPMNIDDCEGQHLPASVGECMHMLIEFWVKAGRGTPEDNYLALRKL